MKANRLVLGIALSAWLTATVHAQFTYMINGGTVTITGYTGTVGVVSIPGVIEGRTVTTIGSYSFSGSGVLTDITMSDSITKIENSAFQNCAGLVSVAIGNGVSTIEQGAFQWCSSLRSISIPNSVSSLGMKSFFGCTALTSAGIGNGITSIAESMFVGCPNLLDVAIGSGVVNIEGWAFWNCRSLRSVTLPSGVTNIAGSAFLECDGLTNITIPDRVSSIGNFAYSGCDRLTNATIGSNVATIGSSAFSSCTNLKATYFRGNAPTPGVGIFSNCPNATVYFKPGATGWPEVPNPWAGRPTALWLSPFLVTFDTQGGAVSPTSMTVTNGLTYGILPTPTRAGYAFDGWWTGASGAGAQVTSQSVVTNTTAHSLYAKWLVPILEISPASTNFTSSMSSGSVNVAANIPWTARSNATWIAVTGGASGMTNGTVTFNVATNPGTLARTGSVVVTGAGISITCAVTQTGAAAALAIAPVSTNFTCAAVSGRTIGITANIEWTASTNQPWLRISSGYSGGNNGTVTFSVTNNPFAFSRTGGVIIAGGGFTRTCTVIQTGVAVQRLIQVRGNLSFGNVVTGQTATAPMIIDNLGNAPMAVSGIEYPTGFSGMWSGSIELGDSIEVMVSFRPNSAIAYGGAITVLSDATSGTNTISASGAGMAARPAAQDDEGFGVVSNRFGFNINWANGMVVVVDACLDLANPAWFALQTNILTNGTAYFGDPEWTNFPGRFYRLRSVP